MKKSIGKIKCNCASCGKELFRFPAQLRRLKHGSFCDRHCLGAYRSKHLVKQMAANYKEGNQKHGSYINVLCDWHPKKNAKGYVALHRLIMEAHLGRFLEDHEIVHHKDDNQTNNCWDNLEVMTQSEHARIHNNQKERNKDGTFQNSKRNDITNIKPTR